MPKRIEAFIEKYLYYSLSVLVVLGVTLLWLFSIFIIALAIYTGLFRGGLVCNGQAFSLAT